MSKRAVILVGGKGTRLRPYTVVLPKPLMPIGDYPILEVIIRQLSQGGFSHITLAVNHQADIIKSYFGNGKKWNVKIDYSLEEMPLSTMGPLKLIKDLPDNFLVMNGDVLSDINFSEFFDKHVKSGSLFTISASERLNINEYGVLRTDDDENLVEFKEKPRDTFLVSMGIYALSNKVLDYIPEGEAFGFDHLMYKLIEKKHFPKVLTHLGSWLDIGRPDDYVQAIDDFERDKKKYLND